MEPDGGSQRALRRRNEKAAISALIRAGRGESLTRTELADQIGLTTTAVSNLLDSIPAIEVRDPDESLAPRSGRSGPQPQVCSIAPDIGFAVGVDFGHSHVRVALGDVFGDIVQDATGDDLLVETTDIDVAQNSAEALDWASSQVRSIIDARGVRPEALVGVGIAIAGPIDQSSGLLRNRWVLPDWSGLNVSTELQARLLWSCPFIVDNDANLGALAEYRWGAGAGHKDMIYVKWSRGIGCGIIVNGATYRGFGGIAGELGRMRVQLDDGHTEQPPAPCDLCGRRDCIEAVASTEAILRDLPESIGSEITMSDVVRIAMDDYHEHSLPCRSAIERAAAYLGQAIGSLSNLLNPRLLVIGGAFPPEAYSLFAPELQRGIRDYSDPAAFEDVVVVAGRQTKRSAVHGAIALVHERKRIGYLLACKAPRRDEALAAA